MPELRSRTLMLLSNRTADSLVSPDDKSKLAEEIRSELNRPLNDDLPDAGHHQRRLQHLRGAVTPSRRATHGL